MLVTSIAASAATKVAIMVDGTIDESDKSIIYSRIATVLNANKKLDVLERESEFMDMLTKEQAYQLSGEVAPSEICKLGLRWGANYIIGVYITENRGNMVAQAAIINTKTGKSLIKISNHRSIKSFEDLTVFAQTLGVNINREVNKVF